MELQQHAPKARSQPAHTILRAAAILLPTGGCAAVPFEYVTIPIAPVRLRCHDGYMAYNNKDAKKVLIVPYIVSEAILSVCQDKPLAERAREAAEKHLGDNLPDHRHPTPLPLNYEYSYSCDAAAPAAPAKPASPAPATAIAKPPAPAAPINERRPAQPQPHAEPRTPMHAAATQSNRRGNVAVPALPPHVPTRRTPLRRKEHALL